MTIAYIMPRFVMLKGHAGDKVPCAMLTALTVALINYFYNRLNIEPNHKLVDGYFYLDKDNLPPEAMLLVDQYEYSLEGLASAYPQHIKVTYECKDLPNAKPIHRRPDSKVLKEVSAANSLFT